MISRIHCWHLKSPHLKLTYDNVLLRLTTFFWNCSITSTTDRGRKKLWRTWNRQPMARQLVNVVVLSKPIITCFLVQRLGPCGSYFRNWLKVAPVLVAPNYIFPCQALSQTVLLVHLIIASYLKPSLTCVNIVCPRFTSPRFWVGNSLWWLLRARCLCNYSGSALSSVYWRNLSTFIQNR